MRIKRLRLHAAVLMLALLAAACGGGADDTMELADPPAPADAPSPPSAEADGEPVTISIESWRSDDLAIWEDQIIPAFEAAYPNIDVEFTPTVPTEYNGALDTRLAGGTAGDLITCRPFDASLALFDRGDLASLNDLPGIENFSPVAQSAWITDDGSTKFCVPMASVIHGFIYNKDAFDELGLSEPRSEEEFFEMLAAIAADGTYTPLSMGLNDLWEAATMGFQNVGPNYWKGEEGRLALLDGSGKMTDQAYVGTFAHLERWGPYLPAGASAVTYSDAQNLFTLGQAAIYPAGSWEISGFNENTDFEMGAFYPPTRGGTGACYISDHTDIGIGMNAATANPEAARTFLSWVATSAFAGIFANALPGFFSLQDTPVALEDPLAQEFVSWRDECESTIRNSYQILSRGMPNFEEELWATSVGVLAGNMTPEEATQRLQEGLDQWHTPGGADAPSPPSAEADGEPVTISIESWRSDDLAIWEDQIIPAFEAAYPNIDVEFTPTVPTEYNGALDTRLAGGTAGDLITCRPFDASLALFDRGDLASLNDLPGIENFSPVAQSAWITDDGSTKFCVPMASVIHGFIYNKDAFDELGLSEPRSEEEFFEMLAAIAADGTYTPLSMGLNDLWEAATMGFQNVGPNYWKGEEGRLALLDGSGKMTDQAYVGTFAHLERWGPYLPAGASAVTYSDAQNLFTLGQAAIYPAGSWEISGFNENTDFEMGAFYPPTRGGTGACYISDHTDIGIGMNAATANPEAARTFLSWVATSAFAGIFANALPGFFSLQDTPVALEDPLAQEFVSWRDECESTIRNSYQILSRGMPNFEEELWATSVGVLAGNMTPEEATQRLQEGLDQWHTPAG